MYSWRPPFFHFGDEIFDELVNIRKKVGTLFTVDVAVITLAPLVIETDYAYAFHHADQAVLEAMRRRRNSFRYAPDNHLNHAAIVGNMFEIGDECRIHVGENAIMHLRRQARQRLQCAEQESDAAVGVRKLSGVDVL